MDQPPPPPGWGADPLTGFLELAYRNRFATFFNKKKEMADLIAIDSCFHAVTDNWLDPANKFTPFLLH